jgi:dihydroneopterin aldolase
MTNIAAPNQVIVVKLGGSLWRSPDLGLWVAALQKASKPVTLVPGGGPFADAVRSAQIVMGFSDAAGHKMAMLGMEQYALALLDGFTGLVCVTTPQEAGTVHAQGRIALWRPSPMVNDSDIGQNWNVTSDSLAAWYAHQSGARTLLLVKSVDAETAPDLHGLVDACLPSFSKGLDAYIAGPKTLASAPEIFARGGVPGARVNFALSPRKIAS